MKASVWLDLLIPLQNNNLKGIKIYYVHIYFWDKNYIYLKKYFSL